MPESPLPYDSQFLYSPWSLAKVRKPYSSFHRVRTSSMTKPSCARTYRELKVVRWAVKFLK